MLSDELTDGLQTRMLITVRSILFTLVLGLTVSPAIRGAGELTPGLGVRFGGEVRPNNVQETTIDESLSYGLTFDVPLAPDKWISVLWSRQNTEVDLPDLLPDAGTLDLAIDYLLAGAAYGPVLAKPARPFVMVAVGITRVDPGWSELDSDLVFSGLIAGGAKFPISERLSFRLDGRAYMNFEEARMTGTCGGVSCSVRFAADGALQLEGLVGVTIAF